MRDELLNGEIFYSLREAQIIIESWRKHYNTKRPHSALGYRPPAPEAIVPMDQRPEPPPKKWSAPIVRKAEDQRWPLRDPSPKRLS